MAPSRPRSLKLPGDRVAALEALVYENRSNVSEEVKSALRARIAAWRAGEDVPKAEHPLKTRCNIWVDDELWDDLRELAAAEGHTATDEAIAAIDAHVAAQQRNGVPEAGPSLRDLPPEGLEWSRPDVTPREADPECPHPKQRRDAKNPDLCRACGRTVA